MKSCKETTNISEGDPGTATGFRGEKAKPHNQEAGPQQDGFHLHIHVQRELDAEVVGVGEDLLQDTAPLLADAADGLVAVFAFELQSHNTILEVRQEERKCHPPPSGTRRQNHSPQS